MRIAVITQVSTPCASCCTCGNLFLDFDDHNGDTNKMLKFSPYRPPRAHNVQVGSKNHPIILKDEDMNVDEEEVMDFTKSRVALPGEPLTSSQAYMR